MMTVEQALNDADYCEERLLTLISKLERKRNGCLELDVDLSHHMGHKNRPSIFFGNRPMPMTRALWMIVHGVPLKRNEWICHHCDNPRCVDLNHIYLGDPKTNGGDSARRNRIRFGERHGRTRLSEDLVLKILYAEGTLESIGRRYGVSKTHVGYIRQGRSWRRTKEAMEAPLDVSA